MRRHGTANLDPAHGRVRRAFSQVAWTWGLAATAVVAACADGGPATPTVPSGPTGLSALGPTAVQELPGQVLTVSVVVMDEAGAGSAGTAVLFQLPSADHGWLTAGGNTTSATVTTDSDGVATTLWTLPQSNGTDSLTVTACGDSIPTPGCTTELYGSPLVFTATIDAFSSWASVAAGRDHTCGLTVDGSLYCWGGASYGQLGAGTTSSSEEPVLVQGNHRWTAVSAGSNDACGITTDSTAYCWGDGRYGQLGDGWSLGSSLGYYEPAPVQVAGGNQWLTVSTGEDHSCGIAVDGTALCWGHRLGPTPTPGGDTLLWTSVSAASDTTCGVTTGGDAYCWAPYERNSPNLVPGSYTWASVSAGGGHACGVTTDANLLCWGAGPSGELGDGVSGTGHDMTYPTPVWGGHTWRSVSAGNRHTCALTTAGEAYCWGSGSEGQLGTGYTGIGYLESRPALVAGRHIWAHISAGSWHTCGVTVQGEAYCWGLDDGGQLGRGFRNQQASRAMPIRVADPR